MTKNSVTKPVIFLFHHFPGECVHFKGGQYSAHDGIPRVMRLMVRALLKSGKYSVKITARKNQVQNFSGFFKETATDDLEVICLEDLTLQNMAVFGGLKKFIRRSRPLKKRLKTPGSLPPNQIESKKILEPKFSTLNRLMKTLVLQENYFAIQILILAGASIRPLIQIVKSVLGTIIQIRQNWYKLWSWYLDLFEKNLEAIESRLGPLFLIKMINQSYPNSIGLIPHYHLFPDCLQLEIKTVMYIPDFIPHFFLETGEFGSHVQESAIGQALVRKTDAVITNSLYSKSYLPNTRLQVPERKIRMFYLPNLNIEGQIFPTASDEISKIKSALTNCTYIFYPTQPRQNKKLDFLFHIFDTLCLEMPDLKLVLTSELVTGSTFDLEHRKMKAKGNVIIFPQVSDEALSWLYQNAAALTFTSVMEGNFPPQVFEALFHRTPIVATRLPLITERLGANSDALILCEPGSMTEFQTGILQCLNFKQNIIQKQESLREILMDQGSISTFEKEVLSVFEGL